MGIRGVKKCSKCRQEKPHDEFYRSKAAKDGRQNYCIACAKERDKARKRPNTPERRDKYLRQTYGISLAEWEAMIEAQGGCCAICTVELVTDLNVGALGKRHTVVDHDHATGKVRGILCNNCNRVLGLFDDDLNRFMSAAAYLLQHENVLATVGGESNG